MAKARAKTKAAATKRPQRAQSRKRRARKPYVAPVPPQSPHAAEVRPGPGRPTIRSEAIEAALIEWISTGQTLRSFCRQDGMPAFTTVHLWRRADPDFAARYEEARLIGADWLADEIIDIANAVEPGEIETVEDVSLEDEEGVRVPGTKRTVRTEDMLGHRKLKIEARLKLLAKWFPQRYGNRLGVEHSGQVGFDQLLQEATGVDAHGDRVTE